MNRIRIGRPGARSVHRWPRALSPGPLSAQGWTFWPLGVHAIAPQASSGPPYGPAGEAVVPGRAARAGEGAGDGNIRQGGRPGSPDLR